jgi:hypothetical protein
MGGRRGRAGTVRVAGRAREDRACRRDTVVARGGRPGAVDPPADRGEGERGERGSSASSDPALDEALANGNRAYEETFGRIFLIRAAGRSRTEILAELNRRLTLDPDTEIAVVGEELRDIALLRIPQVFDAYR